ncbi:hypothetical protein FJR48_06530 [Sulfurimonas lithotrophica]|uniref:Uncharacterized protein n=1 Tax=Sulfurimonas lithotrophica TaxID=2590022 RepID=A0A5P8P138_9BACT|nr:hypothetical protein [Sulfurimonas lithotrophica]QFR49399.1 hypothetical protein FJR48_06530 [Sulfurimonas lithotrophica]
MLKIVKKIKNTETTQQALEYVSEIREVKLAKLIMDLKNEYNLYEKLERIGYKIAIRKAKTSEELELCAVTIEENYYGEYDADLWAEEIRIKAYGALCYINNYFRSAQYEAFVDFTKTVKIQDPFEPISKEFLKLTQNYAPIHLVESIK